MSESREERIRNAIVLGCVLVYLVAKVASRAQAIALPRPRHETPFLAQSPLSPYPLAMPKRATSTSYNGSKANRPGRLPGNADAQFKKAMQRRALDGNALKRVDAMLRTGEADDFKWAWAQAADRGFGRPAQSVDVTSAGDKLPGVILVPPPLPDE